LTRIIETNSHNETFELAKELGQNAMPGEVYALDGDLGCGKTVFAQGFAAGLGVSAPVSSPTFTLLKSYRGRELTLHHFDVYRIGDISEMDELGWEECFYSDGVSLVEWAGLIEELLPADTVHITITKDPEKGFDYRRIEIRK
jgi:tRNA threonylcarbamoyladenosine biosynthesis protein TsaE